METFSSTPLFSIHKDNPSMSTGYKILENERASKNVGERKGGRGGLGGQCRNEKKEPEKGQRTLEAAGLLESWRSARIWNDEPGGVR
jgi:hypothetical protein